MEGSGLGWRGAIVGGRERSEVHALASGGSGLRWRGAIVGKGARSEVHAGGGERSQVEGSNHDHRWRGAVSGEA